MNGHPWDQVKVSLHDRWPLIRGASGQADDAEYNTPSTTTSDMHFHNDVCNTYNSPKLMQLTTAEVTYSRRLLVFNVSHLLALHVF